MWQPKYRAFLWMALSLAATWFVSVGAVAQVTPGAPASPSAPALRLSAVELEKLIGPIALYPDDLLAILLPASTTPIEIVKAQRLLDKRRNNVKLQPDPSLPEPVRNLLNYPDVVKKMGDDLDWTESLGKAVATQQKDVIEAIQVFRRKVYAAGNLKNDDKQIVVVEKEVIKVVQADPQVIYVPHYQPSAVVVAQPAPVVVYYPTAYPVYYYSYPPGTTFATGVYVGAATAYAFSWHSSAIYYGYDVQDLQEERLEYRREAREDWQTHRQEMQGQRQEQRGKGQQAPAQQPAASQQTQRQGEAGTRQASAQAWRPQAQPSQLQAARTQGTRFGDSQFSRAGGSDSAFGDAGSGSFASSASQRGFQSRFGGGGWGGGGGFGGRGGGRRR